MEDRRLIAGIEAPAGSLIARATRVLAPAEPKAAKAALDRLAGRIVVLDEAVELGALFFSEPVKALLAGVFGSSPYLTELVFRDLKRLKRLLLADPLETMEALQAGLADAGLTSDEADLMRRLRLAKQEAALVIGLADLAKAWTTMEVTGALARFADATLAASINFAFRDLAERGKIRLPNPLRPAEGTGLIVLAMGKHGAYELNYSSDVDLIVFYDYGRAAPLLADPDEPVDFFVRLAKKMVRLMQEPTSDGYVFRVDLRLRPDPGATPIAMSTDAAIQYYGSIGQNWERAALIKARPVASDLEAGETFLAELRPFIWRKFFDYAAIADVHSIKRQIHAVKGHGDIAVAGHDVKLGRGGIREIEFFVQTQQLIAGGRTPSLRGRQTLAMLDELAAQGWIEAKVRDEMRDAYLFLRDVEHRIQMIADQQTHKLPQDEAGLARIGRMMGFRGRADFAKMFTHKLETVQRHYQRLFENAPALASETGSLVFTGKVDDPDTIHTLQSMGFRQPGDVAAAIRAWHFGRYPATRSTVARERLTELTPALLQALAATPAPDATFRAFDRFVSRLPTGVQIFSLIASNAGLLSLLAEILGGAAPKLADTLTRRPRVVDGLLDPAFYAAMPSADELHRRLSTSFGDSSGYEDCLDRARIFAQEHIFLIGVRVLTGTIAATEAGEAHARLAGVIIDDLSRVVAQELAASHGVIAGAEAVIVAMGKLGGREMTATSDLDLMLLYDVPEGAEMSDGPRPLVGGQYYARFAQRLVTALSSPTAEGQLYAVDLRLRPSGNKGPLATSLPAFVAYQAGEAWTWEHMALTRARVIAGPPGLTARVNEAIRAALTRPRDPQKLKDDVREMRGLIEAEKGTDDIWNIKQVAGGLVDLEFIAQYLMLAHAAEDPGVLATNTEEALTRLARRGLVDPSHRDVLLSAANLYGRLTQILRLAHEGPFRPKNVDASLRHLLAKAADLPSFSMLEAHMRDTEKAVRAAFLAIVGRPVKR
ncbi:MAG: bifunctional [glutamine synthetase] adenylyltransferase/[glutamine synthetase]-adenylyl-L-tyrosine phosphorylase [Ancalomicrobiaceae bacterium]|nr:bifunctional [glutamine synthetase] adenylyltransferase/[glutamine synthetase]-adenylyl-L-tyrosine phosphorylase [Ancalomicrobiaceae bacterium]